MTSGGKVQNIFMLLYSYWPQNFRWKFRWILTLLYLLLYILKLNLCFRLKRYDEMSLIKLPNNIKKLHLDQRQHLRMVYMVVPQ